MRSSDIQLGEVTVLEFIRADGRDFDAPDLQGHEAVLAKAEGQNEVLLTVRDRVFAVIAAGPADARRLDDLVGRNLPRVAWVVTAEPSAGPARRLRVEVHEFPRGLVLPEGLSIGVHEQALDDIRRRILQADAPSDRVLDHLAGLFLVAPRIDGETTRGVLSAGREDPTQATAFRLHGNRFAADISREHDGRLLLVRVVGSRGAQGAPPLLHLLDGPLRFVDATVATELRGVVREQLSRLAERDGSYLKLWRDYNQVERRQLLEAAKHTGWIRYQSIEVLPDGGYRFQIKPNDEARIRIRQAQEAHQGGNGLELEAAEEIPAQLLPGATSDADVEGDTHDKRGRSIFSGRFRRIERDSIELSPIVDQDVPPPKEGVLFPSLRGSLVLIDRRKRAEAAIRSGEGRMPQLGLLLEGEPVPSARHREIEPLPRNYRRIFNGEPTPAQREALRVALNTPDIALIQGPPGTGKTQVIAALCERLAEISGEGRPLSSQTLITAYQHEAVENAASRTVVFGLPSVKIGRRRGERVVRDGLDQWRRDQLDKLEARLPTLHEGPAAARLRRVRDLSLTYTEAPGDRSRVANLLREAADLALGHVPGELVDTLRGFAAQRDLSAILAPAADADERELAMRAVRGLPTTATVFSDDGPQRCLRLRSRLERMGQALASTDRRLLEDGANLNGAPSPALLEQLASLKVRLIEALRPPDLPSVRPTADPEIEAALARILDALYDAVRRSPDGAMATLLAWRDDLKNDPEGTREAVAEYTLAIAATCGQSTGGAMFDLKEGVVEFETVIIDEAARANPLDLFIPMARANRRVVLVGDHRQLPHLLEPDVERELLEPLDEGQARALKNSMFQILFEELRRRERVSEPRRVVTLDVQFRMHKQLGDFVSRIFYEFNGDGQIASGFPESEFLHDLPRWGSKVAAWIPVPGGEGAREHRAGSLSRDVEILPLVEELSRLLTETPDLSVGVITFYAAQRDAIWRALVDKGIAERNPEGYDVVQHYRHTVNRRKKRVEWLRVGTVDSFQGKEFDVVLLSVVRSNDVKVPDADPKSLLYQEAVRKRFGFLAIENRLCVAMSRQQRLLLVFGDPAMFRDAAALRHTRGLHSFIEEFGIHGG